jgi:hypothetical protein
MATPAVDSEWGVVVEDFAAYDVPAVCCCGKKVHACHVIVIKENTAHDDRHSVVRWVEASLTIAIVCVVVSQVTRKYVLTSA